MDDLEIQRTSYPRVSDIISKQNKNEMSAIPLDALINASIRGTQVHCYCTMYVKNLWIDEVNPEYLPYFEAFQSWYSKSVEKTLFSSIRLYDDKQLFTGEFDMIVKLKTGPTVLVDIKTSALPSKTWPIQLAAYKHLCEINGFSIEGVMNLHLKVTTPPKFEINEQGKKVMISPPVVKPRVKDDYRNLNECWEIFSSALRCYHYFDRKEVR